MAQQFVDGSAGYPWQSIVFIEALFPDGSVAFGSGVMVGPNDVLTAAHVVYAEALGGAAVEVAVTPAYDPHLGTGPFGTVHAAGLHVLGDPDPDGDGNAVAGNGGPGLEGAEQDVALLDLAVPLGESTGWMALDPGFGAGTVNLSGYPGIYGNALTNETGFVQDDPVDWFMATAGLEIHSGNSGGPLWYATQQGAFVVGIVSTSAAAHDLGVSSGVLAGWIQDNDALLAVA